LVRPRTLDVLEIVAATAAVAATIELAPQAWIPVALGLPFLANWLRGESLAALAGPLEPLRAARHAALVLAVTLPPWALALVLVLRAGWVLPPPAGAVGLSALEFVALPLVEEHFFRGYLQPRLERLWPARREFLGARVGRGWLCAALAFGLAHLRLGPLAAASRVVPGLVLGHARAATGSIWAGWLVHMAYNAAGALWR
jgi:hypothetical protein